MEEVKMDYPISTCLEYDAPTDYLLEINIPCDKSLEERGKKR